MGSIVTAKPQGQWWKSNAGWAQVGQRARDILTGLDGQRVENRKATRPLTPGEVKGRRINAARVRGHAQAIHRTLADYEPAIRGLLEWLDTTSTLESWVEDCRLVESMLADIAFEPDATSPRQYLPVEEQAAITLAEFYEQEALNEDAELVEDSLSLHAFEEWEHHRRNGRRAIDVLTEHIGGFSVDVYTDAYTAPAMTSEIGGTGMQAVIESERAATRRRVVDRSTITLDVMGREQEFSALSLLTFLGEHRRWIEDQLLTEGLGFDPAEEGGKSLSPEVDHVIPITAQTLEALRHEWAVVRLSVDDGVPGARERLRHVERLGKLVAREIARQERAGSVTAMLNAEQRAQIIC